MTDDAVTKVVVEAREAMLADFGESGRVRERCETCEEKVGTGDETSERDMSLLEVTDGRLGRSEKVSSWSPERPGGSSTSMLSWLCSRLIERLSSLVSLWTEPILFKKSSTVSFGTMGSVDSDDFASVLWSGGDGLEDKDTDPDGLSLREASTAFRANSSCLLCCSISWRFGVDDGDMEVMVEVPMGGIDGVEIVP